MNSRDIHFLEICKFLRSYGKLFKFYNSNLTLGLVIVCIKQRYGIYEIYLHIPVIITEHINVILCYTDVCIIIYVPRGYIRGIPFYTIIIISYNIIIKII